MGKCKGGEIVWQIHQKYSFDLQISKTNLQLFPMYLLNVDISVGYIGQSGGVG